MKTLITRWHSLLGELNFIVPPRRRSATAPALLLLLAPALLLCFPSTILAQSALDGFDPNTNGIVQVVVVQPDGKILIGGDFTIVQGISRNRIARLNPDGMLDTLFDPNSTGYVSAIAVQADGKILVGGGFNGANSIGGQTRNRIARLDAVTGQADSFNRMPTVLSAPSLCSQTARS